MAHPCISCGGECYCHGDIDDCIVSKTPSNCDSCGCEQEFWGNDDNDFDDEDDFEFYECPDCDGNPACEDFGCAIELGKRKLVKKNIEPGNDNWK